MFISKKSSNFASVIELDRHIEILLLSNDCVIIPGFGGFMTHHINARYEEDDFMFLPPLRTLGFNPQLTMNDSLLTQSYVEAYDLSYPEALRRIEDEVCELRQHLESEGEYELNDIGVLSLNEDGKIIFTPCEAGILTPELYGLGTFEMHRLEKTETKEILPAKNAKTVLLKTESESEPETFVLPTEELEEEEERALVIKMSWIRNCVAVAAAILVFFLMTTPVVNSDTDRNVSQLNSSVLFQNMPKDSNMEKIVITKEEAAPVEAKEDIVATDTLKNEKIEVEDKTVTETCFRLVLASYVTKKNAQALVERLQKDGYQDAEVYIRNNVTRVVYGHFKTLNEAYNKLNSIHAKKDFADAWVMKIEV